MIQPKKKVTAHKKGVIAEKLAALYLMGKGYRILETRFKSPHGEIDLIAKHKDTLVFIEVKAHETEDEALYAVTDRAKTRITNAAYYYLASQNLSLDQNMRFDVVAIVKGTKPLSHVGIQVKHLDNAWMAVS